MIVGLWCDHDLIQTSHMNAYVWMYQRGVTALRYAAENGHFPMVEYLVEKGADIEAKNGVAMSYHWCEITHSSLTYPYLWIYQRGSTPLLYAAGYGHLPMVKYLMEKGANIEAKDEVSDVISMIWNHTYVTHEYICVNVSGWKDSIDGCCNERSLTSGGMSARERGWYGGKG